MNSTHRLHLLAVAACLALIPCAGADHHEMKPYVGSEAFEKIKALAGTWSGVMPMNGQEMPITIDYHVIAGGSAVIETSFAGTPKEMITVYHDNDDGELALIHYCMLQNRPALSLVGIEGNTLNFDLTESCSLHDSPAPHMRSLALTIENDHKILQEWTMWKDGKEMMKNTMTLTRKGS